MANEISRDDLLKAVALVAASNVTKRGQLRATAIAIYQEIQKPEFWQLPPAPAKSAGAKKNRQRVRDLEV